MIKNSKEVKEIHRLLANTIVSSDCLHKWFDGSKEELPMVLAPLERYTKHHTPNKLYKMRAMTDRAIDALENDKIYLTRADFFNDPYDCFLSFDSERLKSAIKRNLSDESMDSFVSRYGLSFPTGNGNPGIDDYFCTFKSKRDEFFDKCSVNLSDITEELQTNTYVASLTESIHSPVMWAHYADNHKGFAIEYEFRKEMFFPQPMIVPNESFNWYGWRTLLPVYYSDLRQDGTALAEWLSLCKWTNFLYGEDKRDLDMSVYLSDMLLKTKLCLQKSSEWAYEHEWRLMITHNWPNYIGAISTHIFYPPSGIFLGDRISEQDSSCLIAIAKKKKIPVYRMYINQAGKEYKMEIAVE